MTRAGPEYRWLLPSAVVAPELPGDRSEGSRPRRTVRDWIVDTCAFVGAVVIGMLAADAMSQASDYSGPSRPPTSWWGPSRAAPSGCAGAGRWGSPRRWSS